jgi:hypothetical protein
MGVLGELRPSQMIFTFGVGGLVDLPNMSGIIMGIDDWDTRYCIPLSEDRLLSAVKKRLGTQVEKLYLPPIAYDDDRDSSLAIGVPVAPFPRWLRCPICNLLATIESGVFALREDRWNPDKTRYVHASCTKAKNEPDALPVRFLIACREGHLSDFPWVEYVHEGRPMCKPARLTMREFGAAGDASDIIITCLECDKPRRMGDAFDRDRWAPKCTGHHPHLRQFEKTQCEEDAKTILLGASNSWFPVIMSAMSIPRLTDKLGRLIDEYWEDLKDMPSLEVVAFNTAPSRMPAFSGFDAEAIWDAIQSKKAGGDDDSTTPIEDLKIAEWEVFTEADPANETSDFKLKEVAPPSGYELQFESTVLVERIREVRALLGFTRIESKGDFAEAAYEDDDRLAPLSRRSTPWVPVSEVRGEGVFLRFKEDALQAWENLEEVKKLEAEFFEAHKEWRRYRRIEKPEAGFPGVRYVVLHSLSHAIMRIISLECGYTAASVRERMYCRLATDEHGPMAGLLIYTAASDSEGTLGGLVALGEPTTMGRIMDQAFESLRICASDPLCAEQPPTTDGRGIHAASCHACLFAPETSCERGNRYLDRATLVKTFADKSTALFKP